MQIKLREVIDALEETSVDKQFYYYINEERIIPFDEEIDLDEVISLPTNKEIDNYGIMCNFIDDLDDEEAKGWLSEAIKGAGAFRRFKTTLDRFGLNNKWLEYKEESYRNLAMDWCEYEGIEYLEDNPYQIDEENVETPVIKDQKKHNYRFINIDSNNMYSLAYLVVDYRKYLGKLKDSQIEIDVDDAVEELKEFLYRKYPIYAIADNGRYIGYAVCKIDNDVVWLEQIFVRKEDRLKGVGRMLFERAEALSKEYGNETLYLYMHPNNSIMAEFLKHNGYDVLNMIEIRKAYKEEENTTTYKIGDHEYKY